MPGVWRAKLAAGEPERDDDATTLASDDGDDVNAHPAETSGYAR